METEEEKLTISPEANVRSMHPHMFAMWLFIVAVSMLFIAWGSAYIVKKGAGDWEFFEIPAIFGYNTVIIALSSLALHWAYLSARNDRIPQLRWGLVITAILAAAFIICQYIGWGHLVEQKAYFVGNPAGSFIYIFTGVHVLHLLGGVVFLGIVWADAIGYRIHSRNLTRIEIFATYWHFLGLLWLGLFIFLTLNN